MNLFASLPMYDLPQVRWATDALWRGFAKHFRLQGIKMIPNQLVHDIPVQQIWSDRQLFFSQCCGYNVMPEFKKQIKVVAMPKFNAPGCCGHDYLSLIVVHQDSQYNDISEMFGAIAVINGPESQSGMNALLSLATPFSRDNEFFSKIKNSGSHIQSLSYLQNKRADVAAIDSITYTLLKKHAPDNIENTRVLGTTYSAPAPPYIANQTASNDTLKRMQVALLDAFADPQLTHAKNALLLDSVEIANETDYLRIRRDFRHAFQNQIEALRSSKPTAEYDAPI